MKFDHLTNLTIAAIVVIGAHVASLSPTYSAIGAIIGTYGYDLVRGKR